jgi:DNA-binding transcriptional LysR family regulator
VPTDAGRSYIAAAKRILADVAEAERAASGEYITPRGDLNVSAPVALGRSYLQPVVAQFLAAFPEVDVQLSLQDRAVNLLEEHIDIALRIGVLADSGLIAVRIGEIVRVVCASPTYLKSRGTPKSPDDLSSHDCISYPPLQSPGAWTFKRDQTEYVVPVRSRLIVSNLEAACDAARAGIGVTTAFSYHVAESIKSGELTPLLRIFSHRRYHSASCTRPIALCRSNCELSWILRYRALRPVSGTCQKAWRRADGSRLRDSFWLRLGATGLASAWTRECRALHPHVRFGSKADILRRNRDVRFGPKADTLPILWSTGNLGRDPIRYDNHIFSCIPRREHNVHSPEYLSRRHSPYCSRQYISSTPAHT